MDSIIVKIVVITILVGVLVSIALADRRIRKERALEDRERQAKESTGKSE